MEKNFFIILIFLFFFIIFVLIRNIKSEGWYSTGTTFYPNWYYNYLNYNPYSFNFPHNYLNKYIGEPLIYKNPIPENTIRWNRLPKYKPMLTSIPSGKDLLIGKWVNAGMAYTDNPNDFTNVEVQQLNLDPARDLYEYRIINKDRQIIPFKLPPYSYRLEDGDRFKIPGMEGKGDFIFNESNKYNYIYV